MHNHGFHTRRERNTNQNQFQGMLKKHWYKSSSYSNQFKIRRMWANSAHTTILNNFKKCMGFSSNSLLFYLPFFLIPNRTPSFWKSSKALRRGRGKNLKLTNGVAIKLFPPLEDEVLRDISFVTVFAGAWSRARVQRLAQRRTEVLTKGKILIIWSVSFKRKHTIAFEWNDIKAKIPVISG